MITEEEHFKNAAKALVDAATLNLNMDKNIFLHPTIRNYLVEEVVENPLLVGYLFKENFIENFLKEIVLQAEEVT